MKNKKGFTLVELLIVIVVIGILSAMMMLSSTETVSSAKVAKIINNLTNWKKAALAWYVDNVDRITSKGEIKDAKNPKNGTTVGNFGDEIQTIEIAKYVNGEFTEATVDGAFFPGGSHPVKDGSGMIYWLRHKEISGKFAWYVCCKIADNDNDKNLIEKLAKNTEKLNLFDTNFNTYTADGRNRHVVLMEVLDFSKR